MSSQVRLVFFGQVLDGFRVEDVKRSVGELFRLDEAKLEHLFCGARTVIKRSLHVDEAAHYVATLEKLGARVSVEPLEAAAPVPSSPPPLSLAPVAAVEEIVCPNCGERQSKRILCRACASDMPRAIAAKEEDQALERAQRLEAARARRGLTVSGAPAVDDDAPGILGFGFSGRMARVPYAAAGLLAWSAIVWLVLGMALWVNALTIVPLVVGMIAVVMWTLRLSVLRLHDLNRSGWWVLVGFVPYVGALASLAIMFWPGSREDNDYGGRPRPGHVLLVVTTLLALCVTIGTAWRAVSLAQKSGLRARPAQSEAAAPSSEAIAAHLRSAAAVQAFREHYWPEATHKAFAVSDSGAWGWQSGASTMHDAAAQALARCEQNRKPYTNECELVNVNGVWLSP